MSTIGPLVRTWGDYTFEWISQRLADVDGAGLAIEILPQARYAKASTSRLHSHGAGPFCRFRIPSSVRREGVYVITSAEGDPLYVGKAVSLSSRFNMGYGNISPKNCYVGGRSTNCKINALVLQASQRGAPLELWFFATPQRNLVEAQLIRRLRPPWNRAIPNGIET